MVARAPCPVLTIEQPDFAPMRARDLLRQRQAHAAALGLGGIERHKQVLGVGDAQAAVVDSHRGRESATRQLTSTVLAWLASVASTALASRLMNICSS